MVDHSPEQDWLENNKKRANTFAVRAGETGAVVERKNDFGELNSISIVGFEGFISAKDLGLDKFDEKSREFAVRLLERIKAGGTEVDLDNYLDTFKNTVKVPQDKVRELKQRFFRSRMQ